MEMQYIDVYKIECTILNTFLSTSELIGFNTEPFKMESKYFTNDFNKLICDRVMSELEAKGSMSLLETKINAWVRDIKKNLQGSFLNIITSSPIPMSVAKRYYEELKIQHFERLANGRN